jgi:hypothetical protein
MFRTELAVGVRVSVFVFACVCHFYSRTPHVPRPYISPTAGIPLAINSIVLRACAICTQPSESCPLRLLSVYSCELMQLLCYPVQIQMHMAHHTDGMVEAQVRL